MPARRFFIENLHDVGENVSIEGSDAHKVRNVLRLRDGDEIEVVDSAGAVFRASLELADGRVCARLEERVAAASDAGVTIDVAQGLPKAQKMDFVVEKLTELGAATIFPLVSERAIVRDAAESKLERWRRIARAAASQSGRNRVTQIGEVLSFEALLARFGEYDAVLFPWEAATPQALREVLPDRVAGARRVLVVIGPEGGFSHAEAERAAASGAVLLSLGERILRTETAALVVLSVLRYLLG